MKKFLLGCLMAVTLSVQLSAQSSFINKRIQSEWENAIQGKQSALKLLSIYYAILSVYCYEINEETIHHYIQKVADGPIYTNAVEDYRGNFIVIADEKEIVSSSIRKIKQESKNIGDEIKKSFGWGLGQFVAVWPDVLRKCIKGDIQVYNYCDASIFTLRKSLLVSSAFEKIYARKKYIDKTIGYVAIVDKESALKNFNFTVKPDRDWIVYVRCPSNKNLLIPFDSFHEYVQEIKMNAFLTLCKNLGAKKVKIVYSKKNQKETAKTIQILGKVVTIASGEVSHTQIRNHASSQEYCYEANFTGKSVICPSQTYWLSKEPSWQTMQQNRLSPDSHVTSFNAFFNYSDDYFVNSKTKLNFEDANLKIGLTSNSQFKDFYEYSMRFYVDFEPRSKILNTLLNID